MTSARATTLATERDTELFAHHRPRARAAEHHAAAHRLRELHVARGARGHRVGAHQQVQRGLPGQAVLRRQRGHRPGRGPRPRAGQGAVRRRARQRAAALGRQRQHGRVPRAARTRRHRARHAPRPGRPPHPRLAGQRQRQALPLRLLRRHRSPTSASTSTRCATSRCEHRPKIIVAGATAYPRIIDPRAVPRDRRRGRRAVHVRRRPRRRAHRRRRSTRTRSSTAPTSSRSRRTRRCAGPRAGCILSHRRARRDHRQGGVPRSAGRPARPRHRGQGGRVPRGGAAGVQGVRRADRPQRRRAGRGARRARPAARVAAAPTTT